MVIRKVVSGGQTGADIAGLEAARDMQIETGGYAPLGYRTENGSNGSLKQFGVVQHQDRNYYGRTKANIEISDGTVVFGKPSSGSSMTQNICQALHKPCIVNPDLVDIIKWIQHYNIGILNVAGNRESVNPGIHMRTKLFLSRVFYIMGQSNGTVDQRKELIRSLYQHGYRWDTYKIENNAERPIEVAPENVLSRILEDLKKRHWDK